MQVEERDQYLLSKEELENKIATYAGGRAAEELIFGSITTGASNDIEQAACVTASRPSLTARSAASFTILASSAPEAPDAILAIV